MTDLLIVVDMQRDFVSGALAASRPAPSFPLSPHAFSGQSGKYSGRLHPRYPKKTT